MSQTTATDSLRYAFVTLLTSDSYLPGALVLAHSLRRAHSLTLNPAGTLTPADIANLGPAGLSNLTDLEKKVDLVCLVTPATVSVRSVKALVRTFDKVVGVEPLSFAGFAASAQIKEGSGRSAAQGRKEQLKAAREARAQSRSKLALLGRLDLGEAAGIALTKLHAWRLTGYDKVIFLDADMLILRPLAHLFSITSPLAASPDIGWPDAFNSGLMVLTPSQSTFSDIREFAISRGSWDGADQGLLNDYFGGDEASGEVGRGGGWQRLPFRYNVTPNAGYTFAPAYERYGRGIMAAHFIGPNKPWDRARPTSAPPSSQRTMIDYDTLLLRWHETYEDYYPAATAKSIHLQVPSVVHSERGVEVVEQPFSVPSFRAVWDAESDILASGSDSTAGPRRIAVRTRGVRHRSSAASLIRGASHVDDLRQMFHGDIVAASIAAEIATMSRDTDRSTTEGIYISLPLDGRISLMGIELDSGAEEDESPGSDETIKAMPTPTAMPDGEMASGEWSPPKVAWDPAKAPPPVGGGSSEYQMRAPVDAFYENVWDQPRQPRGKTAFFEGTARSSSQTRTIAKLQREHYFDNLGSERPDPSQVKPVFPWEESATPRTMSTRIFPDEEPVSVVPGSRGLDASLEAGSASPSESSSGSKTQTPGESGSTTVETSSAYQKVSPLTSGSQSQKGLPTSLSYQNAWDQVGAIGAKQNQRSRSSSNRGVQTGSADIRSSRSSQTVMPKYRHRSSHADGTYRDEGGSSHRRSYGSSGTGAGGMGQGLRDTSADQSADGDNESSSSEEEEGKGDGSDNEGGNKWRREGPGPGYQRKVERQSEQAGMSPRSPRTYQNFSLGAGGGSAIGGGRGSVAMDIEHSRSSSGGGDGELPPILAGLNSSTASTRRSRSRLGSGAAGGVDPVANTPDMSLSTAYEVDSYEGMSGQGRGFSRHYYRGSPPGSAPHSGSSSPTIVITPLTRSPAASRSNLRQLARTHAQVQNFIDGGARIRPPP